MCVNKCNVQLSAGCWPWISTFILYATMHHHVLHPSHVFKDPKTNPPQEKKGCKNRVVAVVASCFFFFRIVNINIKTKFREAISLGLEAISLLFASKIPPGSQSRFVWRAFKNDFLRTTSRYITRRKMSGRLKLKEFKKTTVRWVRV